MPYNNYYVNPCNREAYERGWNDAMDFGTSLNPYCPSSQQYDAYKNGFLDWFDSDIKE